MLHAIRARAANKKCQVLLLQRTSQSQVPNGWPINSPEVGPADRPYDRRATSGTRDGGRSAGQVRHLYRRVVSTRRPLQRVGARAAPLATGIVRGASTP